MGILIKMNDLYYNPTTDNYDSSSQSYTPLSIADDVALKTECTNSTLSIESLFVETTIESETFKPIDKFENFSVVSSEDIDLNSKGIKTTKQLIVQKNDCRLDLGMIKYLNSLVVSCNLTNEDDCKIVLSTDKGTTWKYWNGVQFITTTSNVPLKDFSILTNEELSQWDSFMSEVETNGMTISTLSGIDLKFTAMSTVRFAFVISRDNYNTQSEISNFALKYEEISHLERMNKNTEYVIDMYDSGLRMTSQIDNTHIELYALMRETKLPNPPIPLRYLDTPVLTGVENEETQKLNLSWNAIDNAYMYKIFLNGEFLGVSLETSYTYRLDDGNLTYSFCVRAYPSDTKTYRASKYSNEVFVSKLNLLGIKVDEEIRYIAVKVDGEIMKIRIN